MAKKIIMRFVYYMKIQNVNTSHINFRAGKQEIKQADDINRRAKQVFPMVGNTYMENFYSCFRNTPNNLDTQKRFNILSRKISDKISELRDKEDENNTEDDVDYTKILDCISKYKIGNCYESSVATLAALAANGIYDARCYNLGVDMYFISKKNDKIEHYVLQPLDHSFVVTTMNKIMPKEKDKIVLDSWFGFTDSVTRAREKYKHFCTQEILLDNILQNFYEYKHESKRSKKVGKLNDYEVETNMVFYRADNYTEQDVKDFGLYCRQKYNDLVL